MSELTTPPSPHQPISVEELAHRYNAYAIELMGEALIKFSNVIRFPERSRGNLIQTLEHLLAALRQEPYRVYTEHERKLHLRSLELLDTAYDSVNGSDTTEGRAKLYTLVNELRNQ